MIDYHEFEQQLRNVFDGYDFTTLRSKILESFNPSRHSKLAQWSELLKNLPDINPDYVEPNSAVVSAFTNKPLSEGIKTLLRKDLMNFHPWRKGPYNLFGVTIDSEWRSDWKWNRLAGHISPLKGRRVFDVGCGNGYHCWRAYGTGARLVLGIDPYLLSVVQFYALKHFFGKEPVFVLPLALQEIPQDGLRFDTVFSMGVLYHQKSPIGHLNEVKSFLRPGGELVLETLVIDDHEGRILVPEDRYAKMRNVWFLPACSLVERWLKRCGYSKIRLVDVTRTTIEEQRSTPWMTFESLPDFLDPANPERTVEGLPSPRRAIFIAENI